MFQHYLAQGPDWGSLLQVLLKWHRAAQSKEDGKTILADFPRITGGICCLMVEQALQGEACCVRELCDSLQENGKPWLVEPTVGMPLMPAFPSMADQFQSSLTDEADVLAI